MLHAILMILKIVGVVLLILLGTVLVLLAAGLFSAVGYDVSGSYYEKQIKGKGRIWWFFHMISVRFEMEDSLKVCICILGIPVKRFPADEKEKTELTVEEDLEDGKETVLSAAEVRTEEPAETKREEPVKETKTEKLEKEPKKEEKKKAPERKAPKKATSPESVPKQGIGEKAQSLLNRLEQAKAWWYQEDNIKMRRLIFRQAKKIGKHILPKKLEGRVRFGFDDPYVTGQVLSFFSMIYPWIRDSLQVCPVFDQEEMLLEGELRIRGRIRIGVLLWYCIRLLFNKNIRALVKKALNR